MSKKATIQSAGWIIYYLDENKNPKFLIIKRLAKSWKIEWVAPKWKVKEWENPKETALREVSEETGLPINKLKLYNELWVVHIRYTNWDNNFDKDVTFFLIEYLWDPQLVKIIDWEGYIWIYKWATIEEIINLIYYPNLREIFVKAYWEIKKKLDKKDFFEKILSS